MGRVRALQYLLAIITAAPDSSLPPHFLSTRTCTIKISIVLWTNRYLSQNNWTRVRDVFPMKSRPVATYYRPHVIYNPSTKL